MHLNATGYTSKLSLIVPMGWPVDFVRSQFKGISHARQQV